MLKKKRSYVVQLIYKNNVYKTYITKTVYRTENINGKKRRQK